MTAFFVVAIITIVISRALMPRVSVVVSGSVMTAIMAVIDAASGYADQACKGQGAKVLEHGCLRYFG